MAPVKFDDISKVASSVLGDDYQEKGYVFKTKQKTSWGGAVVSSQVDLFGAKEGVQTPAKLTWKLPVPLGCTYFGIDKLELDKAGKMKLECSSDKVYKDLKVEVKSDLVDPAKVTAHCTYTGMKDMQMKLDTFPMNPTNFTAEATYSTGIATVGAKCTAKTLTAPDIGVRLLQGPYFCSLMVKESLGVYAAHGYYKASDKLKCAAAYTHGGKASGNFSLGLFYQIQKGTSVKGKVAQDQSISFSVKHEVSKGFSLIGGGKFDTKKGGFTYGLQLSVE